MSFTPTNRQNCTTYLAEIIRLLTTYRTVREVIKPLFWHTNCVKFKSHTFCYSAISFRVCHAFYKIKHSIRHFTRLSGSSNNKHSKHNNGKQSAAEIRDLHRHIKRELRTFLFARSVLGTTL